MEQINHFEKNRPVHLAVRDVHFEHAIKLLADSRDADAHIPMNMQRYEKILHMLRTAREHARVAARNKRRDAQFCDFIMMMSGNVKAVLSMLNLKHAVERMDGFLELDDHHTMALQAEEYERRARDIVQCLLDTLDLAGRAYHNLKTLNWDHFNEMERSRYEKASAHYALLLEKELEIPKYKRKVGIY
jgi:hypothetical protein